MRGSSDSSTATMKFRRHKSNGIFSLVQNSSIASLPARQLTALSEPGR